jgi:glyoxylate reductase
MERRGKQLGLVGVGRIGRAVADKAPAFGMSVAYTARREADIPNAAHMSLDRLLSTSDVVSLHCPLVPETHHLITAERLAQMRSDAYLVNTTRGPVVDEAALADALRGGVIRGAGLDVFEHEPEVHPALLELENAVLIPHLGSATLETRTAMADAVLANLRGFFRDGRLVTPVPV